MHVAQEQSYWPGTAGVNKSQINHRFAQACTVYCNTVFLLALCSVTYSIFPILAAINLLSVQYTVAGPDLRSKSMNFENTTEISSVPDGPHGFPTTTADSCKLAYIFLKGIHMSSVLKHFFCQWKRWTADRCMKKWLSIWGVPYGINIMPTCGRHTHTATSEAIKAPRLLVSREQKVNGGNIREKSGCYLI